MLCYLLLASNVSYSPLVRDTTSSSAKNLTPQPSYEFAAVRAANVPKRGIGEKTLHKIVAGASSSGKSTMVFIEELCQGKIKDTFGLGMKKTALKSMVDLVQGIRERIVQASLNCFFRNRTAQ